MISQNILIVAGLFTSLFFLVHSSERFVRSSARIGYYYNLPKFLIGLLFLSIGTSLPELVTSVIATLNNVYDISVANALGSNITNIFLILGILGIVGNKVVINKVQIEDVIMFFISSMFIIGLGYKGYISIYDSLILITSYTGYLVYTLYNHYKLKDLPEFIEKEEKEPINIYKEWFFFIISSVVLYFSAKYTVRFIVDLSTIYGISNSVIASTVIALGTSLPELTVTYSALKTNEIDMIVGDLLGSNIFNALIVIGIPSAIYAQKISYDLIVYGFPMLFFATMMMIGYLRYRKIRKIDGLIMLIMYLAYIAIIY